MNLTTAKVLSIGLGAALMGVTMTTPVLAWPTRSQEVTCSKIHWEMQNDTSKTYEFVGRVTSPVSYEIKQSVKPNDWGVLDKAWNLTGKVNVKATISMGGDTRTVEKTLDCPVPTPTPTPSPKPSPTPTPTPSSKPSPTPTPTPSASPSPTPTPSATPCPTPSPTPCTNCGGNDNHQEQHQEQHNNQVVNVTVLPETGLGSLATLGMFGGAPLGLVVTKWGKGRIGLKKDEEVSEFASRIFGERNSQ